MPNLQLEKPCAAVVARQAGSGAPPIFVNRGMRGITVSLQLGERGGALLLDGQTDDRYRRSAAARDPTDGLPLTLREQSFAVRLSDGKVCP